MKTAYYIYHLPSQKFGFDDPEIGLCPSHLPTLFESEAEARHAIGTARHWHYPVLRPEEFVVIPVELKLPQ